MAFDAKKLVFIGSGVNPINKKATYESTDDVTTEGYFPATCGLVDGDIVEKKAITRVDGIITACTLTAYIIAKLANGNFQTRTMTSLSSLTAADISFDDTGLTNISGATVQAALVDVDTSFTPAA